MKNYFKLSRIRLSEIFEDTYTFLKEKYKQTDKVFSEASPYGQLLSVINRLFGLNMYYIEDSISELNINTCSRPSSVSGLASLVGHQITRAIGASGLLAIMYNQKPIPNNPSKIFIPNFVRLKSQVNNLNYIGIFNSDELIINIEEAYNKYYTFKVYQGEVQNQTFTGTGDALQTFECNMVEGEWIDHNFVNVYVNGERYKKVDSLYDMGFQEKCVLIRTGITSGIDIIFGNGSFGYIPELGSEISVEYLVTEGGFGNIEKTSEAAFQFLDVGFDSDSNEIDLNIYFTIGMKTNISLGSFPESTDLTKVLAPTTSRSMVLAQTTNYENFFRRMGLFSFIKVYTEFNMFDPYVDNIVYIFLIPDIQKRLGKNIDYFTLDSSMFKLTDYEKFNLYQLIEESDSKIFGTVPHFIDPNFNKYGINVYVKMWSNYNESEVRNSIINEISNYLVSFKRIDYIPKSDVIGILEKVDGIDSVSVEFFSEKVEKLFELLMNKNGWYNIPTHSFFKGLINFNELDIMKLEYFFGDDLTFYNIAKQYVEIYKQDSTDSRLTDLYYKLRTISPDNDEYIYSMIQKLISGSIDFWNLPNYKTANINEMYNFFMSLDSIRNYVFQNFDDFGNILLQKNEYPLFRGDYTDRYGNYINDNVLDYKDKLQPINIFFETVPVSNNLPISVSTNNSL